MSLNKETKPNETKKHVNMIDYIKRLMCESDFTLPANFKKLLTSQNICLFSKNFSTNTCKF